MNSKRIGNIGEAVAIAEFTKLGIPVYLPFGDDERADLIAEFDGKYNAIQVKTAEKADNNSVIFNLTSSSTHRRNGNIHKYTKDEIDYFFCYCIERNINYEDDYLFENVMKEKIPIENKEKITKIATRKKQKLCPICGKEIMRESKLCVKCTVDERNKNNPDKETLIELISQKSIPDIASECGVSATTVRRWLKKHNLPHVVDEIKKFNISNKDG